MLAKKNKNKIRLAQDSRIFQQLNIKESSASIADAIRDIEIDYIREIKEAQACLPICLHACAN